MKNANPLVIPPRPAPALKPKVTFDSTDIPTGMVRRRQGDVILFGDAEYVTTLVNQCRAVLNDIKKPSVYISISTTCDPTEIARRMQPEEIKNFLARIARRDKNNNETSEQESENDMAKNKTKKVKAAKREWKVSERTEVIAKMIADGKSDSQIEAHCADKFTGSNMKNVKHTIASQRDRAERKAEKGNAKPAKAAKSAKAAKVAKPAKKGAKKVTAKAAQTPPPRPPRIAPPPRQDAPAEAAQAQAAPAA